MNCNLTKKIFALLCCLLIPASFLFSWHKSNKPLNINIITYLNGFGLQSDYELIKEEIENLGHRVNFHDLYSNGSIPKADVNIFFEQVRSDWYKLAKQNWFVPNAEWYSQPERYLEELDRILCKTHEAVRIFKPINSKTMYLGFISFDNKQNNVPKDFSHCLHLAGGSLTKGTPEILIAWTINPELPQLTVIKHTPAGGNELSNVQMICSYLPKEDLATYQNHCGIHICPSQTEGFGHYIMEAMSTGSVVVTTDAPPMNEFIKDKRCLVKYKSTTQQSYATLYHVEILDLNNKVAALQNLPQKELKAIGEKNRAEYLRRKEEFRQNLKTLLEEASRKIHK